MDVRVHIPTPSCSNLLVDSAPMLVVLKDRGQTLRLYNVKSTQMQLNAL